MTIIQCPRCGNDLNTGGSCYNCGWLPRWTSYTPMTPEGVAKAVEPDPQNDEICRLKADLARVTAERDRLMDRIHGAQAVILGWVCAETDEVILTMLEMITEELRPSDKALENEERPTHKFQPGDYDEDGGVIPSVESEDE